MAKTFLAALATAALLLGGCGTNVGPSSGTSAGASATFLPPPPPVSAAAPSPPPAAPTPPVAAYRLAPPQVMMEPLPTAAVLLTDDPARADANQNFCEKFFAGTPSAESAIAANENVVQVFWPTEAVAPTNPPAGDTAKLAAWCSDFLKPDGSHYSYQRAAQYLQAVGHGASRGPVFVVLSSGDLRYPTFVLDGDKVPADKTADFAGVVVRSVSTVSANVGGIDQKIEQTALTQAAKVRTAATAKAKSTKVKVAAARAASCTAKTSIKNENDTLHVTSEIPDRCLRGGEASAAARASSMTPAVAEHAHFAQGGSAAASASSSRIDLISADTNPAVHLVCDIAGDVLPDMKNLGPFIAIGGDVLNWGVCEGGVRATYEWIKKFYGKPKSA